ncbi:hypothetical protein BpHYR1_025632 [Brachionus plicatilis]|uniref:Uncharacterized protein n=1 Tax=Brachionus plicatilis TaxID=10195 RepID=A0A3M7SU63_BRAPC|nr:hypothetical protein BpHYR1_025632 [Brachionus plicatilis]
MNQFAKKKISRGISTFRYACRPLIGFIISLVVKKLRYPQVVKSMVFVRMVNVSPNRSAMSITIILPSFYFIKCLFKFF